MTKYTIFCVLGLALLIGGAKQWLFPGSKPANNSSAANLAASDIKPLSQTNQAGMLGTPNPTSGDAPQANPAARQPDRSFTPGSTLLANAVQEQRDASPGPTDNVPPSVLPKSPQPAPLALPTTFKPQPREANPNAAAQNNQGAPHGDGTHEQQNMPADFFIAATTTVQSAGMIADATARSTSTPNFAALKPLADGPIELQFPEIVQKQIHLGGPGSGSPISPYGLGQDPNTLRNNEARNPAQVKADSLVSHNLVQGAQLAFQSAKFPMQHKLEGRELTLQDLFIITTDPKKRYALLRAYWKVALAMAEYNWAVEEYYTLEPLKAVGFGNQVTASHRYIEAAINSSMARVSETRIQTINAQFELLTLMGGKFRAMPLCVDIPLVGTYNTQYEKNFPTGQAPARLREIAQTVDLRRDVVNARCLAVNTTFDAWANSAIPLFRQGPTELNAQVIAIGYEQVTRHRRNFLAAIRDYNNDIAEYALTVLSSSLRPDQLASYLTRTPSLRPLWNTSAMISSETADTAPALEPARSDSQVRQATFSNEAAGEDWSRKTREVLPSVMSKK
jgi:hypothetical protein